MTQTADTGTQDAPPVEMVTLTIDDVAVSVPKGTLVIRAAELMGVQIPRFCDHPLLDPVGACRQCLVEVEGQRKPMASCTITVTEGMVVRTQYTSESADKAQHGVMELLLINHPLDCPVCDKGGECPLQNQAMSNGRAETRFADIKRTFPKPINLSSQVLLDRERCVLCARCTRFSNQIAGDPFIELLERGALQQVGIAAGEAFDSYFSGNTVQICPVGALTGTAYRFRARPFDLVSSPSVCEHCASGCAQRTDHRRGVVLRRLAGDDPEVNEEWNCDKGRWAFTYPRVGDRIETPLVRDDDGSLRPASWSEAIGVAVAGLTTGPAGVLVGGRVTTEDAYAYAKFARIALGTNDIDFRSRPHSAEEAQFLAAQVASRPDPVTYSDLEAAPVVVLAGFEPEEESPIIFLRLRKAARKHGLRVISVAPFASRGATKLNAQIVPTVPGEEATALEGLAELSSQPGAIILVGERLATCPGALSAAIRLAARTGARLAWVPRRAGERGALDAGCLPSLLPGGRPVDDDAARREIAESGTSTTCPHDPAATPPRFSPPPPTANSTRCSSAASNPQTWPTRTPRWPRSRPPASSSAWNCASRRSPRWPTSCSPSRRSWRSPARSSTGKDGSARSTRRCRPTPRPICGCCRPSPTNWAWISASVPPRGPARRSRGWAAGTVRGRRLRTSHPPPRCRSVPARWCWQAGECCWTTDGYRTASRIWPAPPAPRWRRVSAATAAAIGASDGDLVAVSSGRGAVTLPVAVTAEMADRVVWLPLNSPGSAVHDQLAVTAGAVVQIEREEAP